MTLGILLVVIAIAIPQMQQLIRTVRLRGAGTDYANLLQNARIRAVKDGKYYTTLTDTVVTPSIAFVDINGSGAYEVGEPMMAFRANTSPAPFGAGPSLANLKMQFLPPTPSGQASLSAAGASPSFGSRGLPCTPVVGATGSTTCPYLTPPNFTPTSFVTFVQDTSGGWVAITVTPAGRIREWAYGGNGNWSPLD